MPTEPQTIAELMTALSGGNGWVVRAVAWMGTIRLVTKLVSHHFEQFLTAAVSASEGDEYFSPKVQSILKSRPYRITAFLIDYFLSIKLPKSK